MTIFSEMKAQIFLIEFLEKNVLNEELDGEFEEAVEMRKIITFVIAIAAFFKLTL